MTPELQPQNSTPDFREKDHWNDHIAVAEHFGEDPLDPDFLQKLNLFKRNVVTQAKVTEYLPVRFLNWLSGDSPQNFPTETSL